LKLKKKEKDSEGQKNLALALSVLEAGTSNSKDQRLTNAPALVVS